ncbi:MAG: polymer-forming cytoskeletal protein [Acidobacteria bacterium]|nr:polymer-forming cytoskeletal protein [Acidobacteriota bacterium]
MARAARREAARAGKWFHFYGDDRFRVGARPKASHRYFAVSAFAVAMTIPALTAPVSPTVITAEIFIVEKDNPIDEDVYVASTSGRVEGLIDGDLTIITGDLTISGTITGSVIALTSGTVRVEAGGVIGGSLRSASPSVVIDGAVDGDTLVTGAGLTIGDSGSVGSDVIYFGGVFVADGSVGRDVRGRMITAGIDGSIGRDVDIAVEFLTIGASAEVGGDVLYRSANDASISSDAEIAGGVFVLPAQSNFFYGVLLTMANVIGFLGFVVAGLLAFWLLRSTGEAAVAAISSNPIKSLLIGLGVVLAGPIVVVLLAATLVGLPLAALVLFALLLGLIFGPVPWVTAVADLLFRPLKRKPGLFGAFVIGAVLWRFGIWIIPVVGALLYLIALIWGIGGWVLGGWRIREARDREREVLPEAMIVEEDEIPEGWEYPLAPKGSAAVSAQASFTDRVAGVMAEPDADDDDDPETDA